MPASSRMADLTWHDVQTRLEAGAIVLVPVGAQEGHGTHLPLGTDTVIAQGVCDAIAGHLDGLVAPAVPFGYKSQIRTGGGHHWPGNIGLDGDLLIHLVRRILKDLIAKGADRIAVVNAHLENSWFITEACNLAVADHPDRGDLRIMAADWWAMLDGDDMVSVFDPPPGDISYEHAALVETSVMLHLAPDTVDMTKAPAHDFVQFPPYDIFPPPADWITESGALAPALNADAGKGQRIIELAVSKLARAMQAEFGESDP